MVMTIKVTYTGEMSEKKDAEVKKIADESGWKWYAQGYDFENNIRDIVFEYEFVDEENTDG
jgi:hypothetical protein